MPVCLKHLRWLVLGCVVIVNGGPVQSADAVDAVVRCVITQEKAGKDGSACIGRYTNACSERPGAQSTAGQAGCADREQKLWNDLLKKHLRDLLAVLDAPEKKEKLQAAQAAWRKLRDADCTLAYYFFDGGTMAVPLMRYCTMKMTAERSLMLRQWQKSLSP